MAGYFDVLTGSHSGSAVGALQILHRQSCLPGLSAGGATPLLSSSRPLLIDVLPYADTQLPANDESLIDKAPPWEGNKKGHCHRNY